MKGVSSCRQFSKIISVRNKNKIIRVIKREEEDEKKKIIKYFILTI
jgi:hypothetical protein